MADKLDLDRRLALATRYGLAFLISNLDSNALWHDFKIGFAYSSSWVTAYVGVSLTYFEDLLIRQITSEIAHTLWTQRRRSVSWGYNRVVPPDADTTGWVLQFAERIGTWSDHRLQKGYQYLQQHIKGDGSVTTFIDTKNLRRILGATRNDSFVGWCNTAHPSVAACLAQLRGLPGKENILAYLRSCQNESGSWSGYWWEDDEYTTLITATALAKNGTLEDADYVSRAVDWAIARLAPTGYISTQHHPYGSPFATALALQMLVLSQEFSETQKLIQETADWLVKQQRLNGSWQGSATMRIPTPDMINPANQSDWQIAPGGVPGDVVIDDRALFTTATAVSALQICRQMI